VSGPAAAPPPRTIAEKLNHLFATVHPQGRGEYTLGEVVAGIREQSGPAGQTVSIGYLWQLRKGERVNPTVRHLEAIAAFFGVSAAYFLDEAVARRVDEQLESLALLRDQQVRRMATRASGLSARSLEAIGQIIENAREVEGLGDQAPRPPRPRRPAGSKDDRPGSPSPPDNEQ
jgi:transcriptional regulator with XRE-family HTH domain